MLLTVLIDCLNAAVKLRLHSIIVPSIFPMFCACVFWRWMLLFPRQARRLIRRLLSEGNHLRRFCNPLRWWGEEKLDLVRRLHWHWWNVCWWNLRMLHFTQKTCNSVHIHIWKKMRATRENICIIRVYLLVLNLFSLSEFWCFKMFSVFFSFCFRIMNYSWRKFRELFWR